jgi:YHS domain-containing protein
LWSHCDPWYYGELQLNAAQINYFWNPLLVTYSLFFIVLSNGRSNCCGRVMNRDHWYCQKLWPNVANAASITCCGVWQHNKYYVVMPFVVSIGRCRVNVDLMLNWWGYNYRGIIIYFCRKKNKELYALWPAQLCLNPFYLLWWYCLKVRIFCRKKNKELYALWPAQLCLNPFYLLWWYA